MTKRSARARTAMTAAGLALATAAHGEGISGTVQFADGALIPEGRVEVTLEDPSSRTGAAPFIAESDGKSAAIAFSLPPADGAATPSPEVVAVLERRDGWLIARGSSSAGTGAPLVVVLDPVIY